MIYGALRVVVIVAFPKGLVGLVELAWERGRSLVGRGGPTTHAPHTGAGPLDPVGPASEETA